MQGLNGSAVLTFIGYKRTDKQAKYIDSILATLSLTNAWLNNYFITKFIYLNF